MINFKLKVVNANKVQFAFGGLASHVGDWRKSIWPNVRSKALRPWLRKQFRTQGAQGEHGQWKGLKSPYSERKARLFPGKPILQASGKMMKDLLSESNDGETTAMTMMYGTDIKYALYHQTGTRKMAARRIFDPEYADSKGTMKRLIRVAVARAVANYARSVGFAMGATDAKGAAKLGRATLRVSEGM